MRLQALTIPMPEEVGKIYRSAANSTMLGSVGATSRPAIGSFGQVSSVGKSGGFCARRFAGKSKKQVACILFGYLCLFLLILNTLFTIAGSLKSGPYKAIGGGSGDASTGDGGGEDGGGE